MNGLHVQAGSEAYFRRGDYVRISTDGTMHRVWETKPGTIAMHRLTPGIERHDEVRSAAEWSHPAQRVVETFYANGDDRLVVLPNRHQRRRGWMPR